MVIYIQSETDMKHLKYLQKIDVQQILMFNNTQKISHRSRTLSVTQLKRARSRLNTLRSLKDEQSTEISKHPMYSSCTFCICSAERWNLCLSHHCESIESIPSVKWGSKTNLRQDRSCDLHSLLLRPWSELAEK